MNSRNKPPKNKKVTLREVAKEAGVSVATTSYILNNQRSFSEETKARVQKAVDKLQYRPNYSAQVVRTGKTKSIGLVLPNLQNPFFPEFAKAVENSAHQTGYSVILIDTQESPKIEKESALRLIELGVDGIIWCPTSEQDTFVNHQKGIPLVVVDRPLPKSNYDVICSDYAKGGELIAEHILKLGHTKIGLISGPQSLQSARMRSQGLKDKLAGKAEIVWEVENPFSSELTAETKAALIRKDVTMVIAGNDLIAIGSIMHLKTAGIAVPESISVIGFDGTRLSDIVSPKLTTIQQPLATLGQKSVSLLMQRIDQSSTPSRRIVLDVKLISGESTIALNS